jgi:hypothetical protein
MTITPRTRKISKVGAAAGGLGLAAVAVLGFSNAAFLAKTDPNADNNWSARGSVTLDHTTTGPLFSFGVNGKDKPWDNGVQQSSYDSYLTDGAIHRQITIDYTGTSPAEVRMYRDSAVTQSAGGDLAAKTNVVVLADGQEVYSGTLAGMPTDYAGAADAQNWKPSSTGSVKYDITITDTGAANGSTIDDVQFIWEAQSV